MTDWTNYIQLKKGDIIKATDEVYCDSETGWTKPHKNTIGSKAPDPQFSAHRIYRRKVK